MQWSRLWPIYHVVLIPDINTQLKVTDIVEINHTK